MARPKSPAAEADRPKTKTKFIPTPLSNDAIVPITETQVATWERFKRETSLRRRIRSEFGNPDIVRPQFKSQPIIPRERIQHRNGIYSFYAHSDLKAMSITSLYKLSLRATLMPFYKPLDTPPMYHPIAIPPMPESLLCVMRKYPWIEWLIEGMTYNTAYGCVPYSSSLDLPFLGRREYKV